MSAVDSMSVLNRPVSDFTAQVNELSRALPNLRCLVLDGRADFNIRRLKPFLSSVRDETHQPWKNIALLSLRDHPQLGLPDVFYQQALSGLVYLDLSRTTGWAHVLQHAHGFTNSNLPNLRVLKLGQMALDSSAVERVLSNFPFQLWSLDVSGNKLKDDFVCARRNHGVLCDVNSRLQNDGHFEVEGKMRHSDNVRHAYFVDESNFSATFSHPLRYLADPPKYSTDSEEEGRNQRKTPVRLVGTEPIRGDSIDDAITALAGGMHNLVPVTAEWPSRVPPGGLTHLHMNGLEINMNCIRYMLETSSGYIEHLECDQTLFDLSYRREWLSKAPWLAKGTVLSGLFGYAYLFRPVILSNLRVLKIHHSLVTNIPTIRSKSTSTLENIWAAEKLFHGPLDLAYPQTYVPDMNPRLYSLTLAHIPRYSPGVIAKRIINFLKLLAAQEQAIEQTKKLMPQRGPLVLRGLRHICLEFDPDAQVEMANLNIDDDVDEAIEEFSSFSPNDGTWDANVTTSAPIDQQRVLLSSIRSTSSSSVSTTMPSPPNTKQIPTTEDGRLNVFPYTATNTKYYSWSVHGEAPVDVWIGDGNLDAPTNTPAVNAYMRALTLSDGHYAGGLTEATCCHVSAGVPTGSWIFGDAWNRLALPQEAIQRPTKAALAECMSDVLQEIKRFRLESRAVYARLVEEGNLSGEVGQHEYWKGRVEISLLERQRRSGVMYGQ